MGWLPFKFVLIYINCTLVSKEYQDGLVAYPHWKDLNDMRLYMQLITVQKMHQLMKAF